MSIDEIRAQKGLVLLEHQECESRILKLRHALRQRCESIIDFGRLLTPGTPNDPQDPNLEGAISQADKYRSALNYEDSVRLATELTEALSDLKRMEAKKREFGLR